MGIYKHLVESLLIYFSFCTFVF